MRIALLGNPDSLHVQRWVRFLTDRGHELLLLVDPHTQHRPAGCDIHEVQWNLVLNVLAFKLTPGPHGNSLWKPRLYRPQIAAFRPDVVHGFEAYYNGWATAWAGPFPKVLSPWGRDVYTDGVGGGLGGWMVHQALKRVDRITCNDESIGPFLKKAYGIAPEKIAPFSWGIDLRVFSKADAAAVEEGRKALGIEPGDRVILSPRKWGHQWGADRIVRALPRVLAAVPRSVAVLLGPAPANPEGPSLKRELEVACDPGRLRWVEPNQSPEAMAQLFSLAEVFVSAPPSDLLSLTILEGMACGCFPVLSELTAYAKHTADPRRAIRVDTSSPERLASALIEALENEALRENAALLNCQAMRREEDATINMQKMEGVYEEAIAAHRKRA
jgi:glycosyltransferase involved in cell wall biosynthesis